MPSGSLSKGDNSAFEFSLLGIFYLLVRIQTHGNRVIRDETIVDA